VSLRLHLPFALTRKAAALKPVVAAIIGFTVVFWFTTI
jgi:hypothetical protein